MKHSQKIFVGDSFTVSNELVCTVVDYIRDKRIQVVFDDGTLMWTAGKELRNGVLKSPYARTVHGVGFIGEGEHVACPCRKSSVVNSRWRNMLKRCYNPQPSEVLPYKGCIVCKRWHNFQLFADDYYEMLQGRDSSLLQIDKDLRVKGNRVYSKATCTLLPSQINSLLINSKSARGCYPVGVSFSKRDKRYLAKYNCENVPVRLGTYTTADEAFAAYKQHKEAHIKVQAEKYRDILLPRDYNLLLEYKILITD